jgi:hypothetical protein
MNHHCLFWLSLVTATWSIVHSEDIVINPWELPAVNDPYENISAAIGDTITFVWPETQNHTVSINPSQSCDDTDATLIGDFSPVIYTITDADITRSPLFFADNSDELCENGMLFTVTLADSAPTVATAPVAAPVTAPSSTEATSTSPSDSPSSPQPTTFPPVAAAPTDTPTILETEVETEAPTTAAPETEEPVEPTIPPVAPTEPPLEPTEAPVVPTEVPVLSIPTEPPVAPTDEPSLVPGETPEPTMEVTPTVKPTVSPTQPGSITETLTGLRMGLAGITTFPQSTQVNWAQTTKEFSESFVTSDFGDSVTNFQTTYEIITVTPVTNRRNLVRGTSQYSRQLQQQAVIIDYTQVMQYDTTDSTITPFDLATAPFETNENKQAYVALLKTTDDAILQSVIGVSNVVRGPTSPPSPGGTTSDDSDDPILSTPAIIGIASGGGALLILIVLYFLYCRGGNRGGGKDMPKDDDPPLHVNVRDDEVSTLAGPTGPPTYGDQRYVEKSIAGYISFASTIGMDLTGTTYVTVIVLLAWLR